MKGIIRDCVKVDGSVRFHFEITNHFNSNVYKEFRKKCNYLQQFHDIHVVFQKSKPTITNLQCGCLLEIGTVVRGELSVTVHHINDKTTVVWALKNIIC